MSLAVLLAQQNDVTVLDIDPDRVDKINRRESTVVDPDIEAFLEKETLSLVATLDVDEAYSGAEFVVVAAPRITTLRHIALIREQSTTSFEMHWVERMAHLWLLSQRSL